MSSARSSLFARSAFFLMNSPKAWIRSLAAPLRRVGAVAGVVLLALTSACVSLPTRLERQQAQDAARWEAQQQRLEATWGIRVEGLLLSSAGYMLDFRYRIVVPEKAITIMDRKLKPYLINERTGQAYIVPSPPKIGALRQTIETGLPPAGKVAFIFFANPGRALQSGELATLVIGDCRIEHVRVQ